MLSQDDTNEVGMSVITPKQFKAKESYWAHIESSENLLDDDGFVPYSPLGRQVTRECNDRFGRWVHPSQKPFYVPWIKKLFNKSL